MSASGILTAIVLFLNTLFIKRFILLVFVNLQYLIFNCKILCDSSAQGLQWDSADSTQMHSNKNEASNCYENQNQTK